MKHKYAVDDTVFVVSYGYRNDTTPVFRTGVVTRVGKKLMDVRYEGLRTEITFDIETGRENTEYQPRTFIYPNKDAYEAQKQLDSAWHVFASKAQNLYIRPAHLTVDDIVAMTRTLTGDICEKP